MSRTTVVCGACDRQLKIDSARLDRLRRLKCPGCESVGQLAPLEPVVLVLPAPSTSEASKARAKRESRSVWIHRGLFALLALGVGSGLVFAWMKFSEPYPEWKSATLVLVDPGVAAIGVCSAEGDGFRAVAKVRRDELPRLLDHLQGRNVPILSDRVATRNILRLAQIGQPLDKDSVEVVYGAIAAQKPLDPDGWGTADFCLVDIERCVSVAMAWSGESYEIRSAVFGADRMLEARRILDERKAPIVSCSPAVIARLVQQRRQGPLVPESLLASIRAVDPKLHPPTVTPPAPPAHPHAPPRLNLDAWHDAQIVLEDLGRTAVGLRRNDDDDLQVVAKVDARQLPDVQDFLRRREVDYIVAYPSLAADVYRASTPGQPLDQNLADRVLRLYRSDWEFAGADPRLVIFLQRGIPAPQLGFLESANPSTFTYLPQGRLGKAITVAKAEVIPGTLQVARGRGLLNAVTNASFLQYCYLMIAAHLDSSPGSKGERRLLACHTEIELTPPVEPKPPKLSPNRRPGLVVHEGGGRTTTEFDIVGLAEAMVQFRLFANKHAQFVRDSANYQRYADYQAAIDDQVSAQLAQFGVETCGRTMIRDSLAKLHRTNPRPGPEEVLQELGATHLVWLNVGRAEQRGDYRLAIRLLQNQDGKITTLWSDAIDDTVRRDPSPERQFHLDSGTIVRLFRPKTDQKPSKKPTKPPLNGGDDGVAEVATANSVSFQPYESPGVLKPANADRRPDHLVYLEDLPTGKFYRPLFSVEHRAVPGELVPYEVNRKPSTNALEEQQYQAAWKYTPVLDINDVPADLQLRYLVCECLRHTLPPAGRIYRVNAETKQAWALFRKDAGLKAGMFLAALRVAEDGSQTALATLLRVNQVTEGEVELAITDAGMESIWPDTDDLRVDDLVLQPSRVEHVVGIMTPLYLSPEAKSDVVAECLGLVKKGIVQVKPHQDRSHVDTKETTAVLRRMLRDQTVVTGQDLVNQFSGAFRKLGVATRELPWSDRFQELEEVDQDREAAMKFQELARLGANHVIGSYIRPVAANTNFSKGVNQLHVHTFDWSVGVRKTDLNPDDKNFIRQSELKANWKIRVRPKMLEK